MNSPENINKRYSDDLYLTFLAKKVEKIVSALYLITDSLDKKEPLRWDIRQEGLVLLSDITQLNNYLNPDKSKIFLNISYRFFKIMSLLELAVSTKLLSEENFDIFEREFSLLISIIENNTSKINKQLSPYLNGGYFKLKDKISRSKEIQNVLESIKDINKDKGHSPLESLRTVKKTVITNNEKKDSRRNNIIKILSKGQKLTIKDISKIITDCSEKTIQRELQKMLKDNLLIKEGERRWSRYFIKA
ncbi:MAG: hypothetical protein KAJ58_00005 [Candidatus Pacebacteria bacterium]|nr:hypothetical protein [Candidatus Paceibacterota bacterium]